MTRLKDIISEKSNNFYILAETAFSHEGDYEYLLKQIFKSKKGDADGIKFQMLLDIEDSYSKFNKNYIMIKNLIFKEEDWFKIINYTKTQTNLEIIILPIDIKALDFCLKNEDLIDSIEIHSINFTNYFFLEKIKNFSKIVILGVGGRSLEEMVYIYDFLQKDKLVFMYGFQSFPTDFNILNLSRIKKLRKIFKVQVGYADHTSYREKIRFNLVEYAYLNGSRIFEFHIIIDEGVKRIDYESAINAQKLLQIRKRIERIIKIQGDNNFYILNESEKDYKNREKKIVAKKDIEKGEIFSENNIWLKVSDEKSDFEQIMYIKILGKAARHNIQKDKVINFSDID